MKAFPRSSCRVRDGTKSYCGRYGIKLELVDLANLIQIGAQVAFIREAPRGLNAVDAAERQRWTANFKQWWELCGRLQLVDAQTAAANGHNLLVQSFDTPQGSFLTEVSIDALRQSAATFQAALLKDVGGRIYCQIDPTKTSLLANHPFGENVTQKFPSAAFDIHEATKSLGCDRDTAAVFHLMRVLERGLTTLANVFGVAAANTNWQNIIDQTQKAIQRMNSSWGADWKEQQQFYSEAALHFLFLKDAWRNHVAHGHKTYSDEEATAIYEHVKRFLQHLATRLTE